MIEDVDNALSERCAHASEPKDVFEELISNLLGGLLLIVQNMLLKEASLSIHV